MGKKRLRSRDYETTLIEVVEGEPPVEIKLVNVPDDISPRLVHFTLPSKNKVTIRLLKPEAAPVKKPKVSASTSSVFELEEDDEEESHFWSEIETQVDQLFRELELQIEKADFDRKYGVELTFQEFLDHKAVDDNTFKRPSQERTDEDDNDEEVVKNVIAERMVEFIINDQARDVDINDNVVDEVNYSEKMSRADMDPLISGFLSPPTSPIELVGNWTA